MLLFTISRAISFPAARSLGHELQSGLRLLPGGFPAKDLELERGGKLKLVQRVIRLEAVQRDLGRNQRAIPLRIIELNQTAGIEIDHAVSRDRGRPRNSMFRRSVALPRFGGL